MENQEITYSFTLYVEDGQKINTHQEALEDAQFTYKQIALDDHEFSITKWHGNLGEEISEYFFNKEVA